MRTNFTMEADRKRPCRVHWLTESGPAQALLEGRRRQSIFLISADAVLNDVASLLARSCRRSGSLVVLFCPRAPVLPCLYQGMDRVIYMDLAGACTAKQTLEILEAPDRRERLIGGLLDAPTATVTFWSGDLRPLVLQTDWIGQRVGTKELGAGGWRIADGGRVVEIGSSKLPAHDILCQGDVEFRRELRRRRWAADESLGGRVRVLRKKLGLRREDFPGIDAKTVARIERNEIRRPQRETLRLISQTLGLSDEQSQDAN